MKVLVIYELFPEETKKTIVEMTQEEYNYFKQANNLVMNVVDLSDIQEDCLMTIDGAFGTDIENRKYCKTEKQKQYFGEWENIEIIEDISDVDKFIWCGFYL